MLLAANTHHSLMKPSRREFLPQLSFATLLSPVAAPRLRAATASAFLEWQRPLNNIMKTKRLLLLVFLAMMTATAAFAGADWQAKLKKELPLLGHRNWIVVADSAYPLQTAPGIETIYAEADQLEVVKGVLVELAKARHVKPTIYTDAEMKFVAETNAPGITAYRDGLGKILAGQPVQVALHEAIISQLDEAGKTFKVLVIKAPLTKPYTSVFFQLECGYWNAGSEQQLRDAMKKSK
jgi:hypothetical protein